MSLNSTVDKLVFICIRLGSRIYSQVLLVFHIAFRQILPYITQWRIPSLSLQLIIHWSSYYSRQYILRTEIVVKYLINNNNINLSSSPSLSTVQVQAQCLFANPLCVVYISVFRRRRLLAPVASIVVFAFLFRLRSVQRVFFSCSDTIWKQCLCILL